MVVSPCSWLVLCSLFLLQKKKNIPRNFLKWKTETYLLIFLLNLSQCIDCSQNIPCLTAADKIGIYAVLIILGFFGWLYLRELINDDISQWLHYYFFLVYILWSQNLWTDSIKLWKNKLSSVCFGEQFAKGMWTWWFILLT